MRLLLTINMRWNNGAIIMVLFYLSGNMKTTAGMRGRAPMNQP
ncbi:hypothetical protein AB28_2483 [Raoultella ornithinolytica 2-156-04_S1_C2]|nr:hypothetical protein AB00_2295 [Raoultella ornithinolytica 2-156-04_S1_C1]KDX14380.1 hypothetical protein AB28_2483 [Raoultella ornithinolytica 2-156-04_S1_C2]